MVDEQKKIMIITLLGTVAVKGQAEMEDCKRGGQPFDEKKHLYRVESENPEFNYYWCDRLARPLVDIIPFDNIRLNAVDLMPIEMTLGHSFIQFNRFGDPKKNRVIKNIVGKYISEKEADRIK